MEEKSSKERVLENCKYLAEYYKNLRVMSYEEIVDIFTNKENQYQIEFYEAHDALNDLYYKCGVYMENLDTNKQTVFRVLDQDDIEIYNNLIAEIQKRKVPVDYQIYFNEYFNFAFLGTCGENNMLFPVSITNKLMDCRINTKNKKEQGDIVVLYDKELWYMPNKLTEDVLQRRRVKE